MEVLVKLYAGARAIAGTSELSVEIPQDSTVLDLRGAIETRCPALSRLLVTARIALNAEYVDDETTIPIRAEIAVIPPVSGGTAEIHSDIKDRL